MGLREDIAMAEAKLDIAIQQVMEGQVADLTKDAMAQAVQTEVYDTYDPVQYQRRRGRNGGLQDPRVMKQTYDPATRTLTVENMSQDNRRPERKIAPMIESGKGYRMFRSEPFPRPFHKETERLMGNGLMEEALAEGLTRMGFEVKK